VLAGVIGFGWAKDSLTAAFQFFLCLLPHLFLFLSSNMMKDKSAQKSFCLIVW
jgi:hypothetical protein